MIRPVRPASGRCLEPQDALSYQFTGAVRVLLSDYLDRLSIAHRNIPLQEFEQAIASRQLSALPMGKEVTIQVLSDNGSVTERKFTDHLVKLDEAGEKWFQNKAQESVYHLIRTTGKLSFDDTEVDLSTLDMDKAEKAYAEFHSTRIKRSATRKEAMKNSHKQRKTKGGRTETSNE